MMMKDLIRGIERKIRQGIEVVVKIEKKRKERAGITSRDKKRRSIKEFYLEAEASLNSVNESNMLAQTAKTRVNP